MANEKDLILDVEVRIKSRPQNLPGASPKEDDAYTIIKTLETKAYQATSDLYARAVQAANVAGFLATQSAVIPPVSKVLPPSSVLATSAELNGEVTDNNQSCVVTFLWGTNPYGLDQEDAADESPVSGDTTTAVSFGATLVAETTYYYRVKSVATVAGVTVISEAVVFTTPAT
jgi:hypothetical protein